MNEKESAENARMLAAIDASIAHWEKMHGMSAMEMAKQAYLTEGEKHVPMVSCCALCAEYHSNTCRGCPVSMFAGDTYCRNTPYAEAASEFHVIANLVRAKVFGRRNSDMLRVYQQNGWQVAEWALQKQTLEETSDEDKAEIEKEMAERLKNWRALSRKEIDFLKRLRD